jgi:hypothetical protein
MIGPAACWSLVTALARGGKPGSQGVFADVTVRVAQIRLSASR